VSEATTTISRSITGTVLSGTGPTRVLLRRGLCPQPRPSRLRTRIYVFCRGLSKSNFSLSVNYWDGGSWHWADQGGSQIGGVSAVTFVDDAGHRRLYVFAKRSQTLADDSVKDSLFVNLWDGFTWQWIDLGMPPAAGPDAIMYEISAISYLDGEGKRRCGYTSSRRLVGDCM
jgi:hypothetical protein